MSDTHHANDGGTIGPVMADARRSPALLQVVLDTTNARGLAEFYRQLLGFVYRAGDEPPGEGQPDERGQDWLVIYHPSGSTGGAFSKVATLKKTTWPAKESPQQLHLDMNVPTI